MIAAGMNDAREALEARLRAMRPRFVATLRERLEQLEALCDRFEAAPDDGTTIEDMTHGAHKIAGVAGMFGAPDLGDCARIAEEAMVKLSRKPADTDLRSDALSLFEDLLGEMAQIVEAGV